MGTYDYDVIVIGSGFGGSVSALRLTEKGYRVGVLEAGRRWNAEDYPEDQLERPQVDLGAQAGVHRAAADQRARQVPGLQRLGRRRWIPDLREHAVRTAAGVLQGPGVGASDRLEGRARAVLRPGQADARRRHQPAHRPEGRPAAAGCQGPRRGRHLPSHRGGRVLQRGAGGRRGRRPVLRRRRPSSGRLHPLLRVLYRLQAQRQEHHDDELPLPRRGERRRGPSADHGHVGGAGRPGRVRHRDGPVQREAPQGKADVHRRAGRLRGRRTWHAEAAAPAPPGRDAEGSVAAARRADPQQFRGDRGGRHVGPATTSRKASRSRRRSIRSRRRTSRCAPTARARTRSTSRPFRWSTAARSGSCAC